MSQPNFAERDHARPFFPLSADGFAGAERGPGGEATLPSRPGATLTIKHPFSEFARVRPLQAASPRVMVLSRGSERTKQVGHSLVNRGRCAAHPIGITGFCDATDVRDREEATVTSLRHLTLKFPVGKSSRVEQKSNCATTFP